MTAVDVMSKEDEDAFISVVHDFAMKELLPKYQYWDEHVEFPREMWLKMGQLGLTGLRIPEEYGGSEASYVVNGRVTEEIAKGDFNCCYAVQLTGLVAEILVKYATDEIKQDWLPRIAQGSVVVGLCLTEPHAGSDAANIKVSATKSADGLTYLINGEKSSMTCGMEADGAVVFARTGGEGSRGVSAFWVPFDSPGIMKTPYRDLGQRGVQRSSVFFDNVEVPAANMLGNEGRGFPVAMEGFDFARTIIGLMCCGAAQQCVDETIEYVKERTAYGQPIAKFQGVAFKIAESASLIEAARALCYDSLRRRDNGESHTMQAAMAKLLAPRWSVDIIHECILLHGHYGWSMDFPIQQRLRDVMGLEIGDGPANIQKMIIARELIGREFQSW